MKKILEIIRNDQDIRYGTVILIAICLAIFSIATLLFVFECIKFPV